MARPTRLDGSFAASSPAATPVARLCRARIELVTPAFGARLFDLNLLKLLILTGAPPIAFAALCSTDQHSVTQISHIANHPLG